VVLHAANESNSRLQPQTWSMGRSVALSCAPALTCEACSLPIFHHQPLFMGLNNQ
jgi:hypothetical protein